jgi:hypothetical protein
MVSLSNSNSNSNSNNNNQYEETILNNFLNFFNKNKNNDLKQWVKNFNEPSGFMFTEANEIITICKAVDPGAKLDNSIVWYLRKCQTIFQNEDN